MLTIEINGQMVEISLQEMQARRMLQNKKISGDTLRENDPSLRRLRELREFWFDYENEKVKETSRTTYWLTKTPSVDFLRGAKPKWHDDTFALLWRWRKGKSLHQKNLF